MDSPFKNKDIFGEYRVSQEEWTKLRESVLMLKYTDITQNTYIQS